MSAVPSQTLLGPALVQPAGEGADTLGGVRVPIRAGRGLCLVSALSFHLL